MCKAEDTILRPIGRILAHWPWVFDTIVRIHKEKLLCAWQINEGLEGSAIVCIGSCWVKFSGHSKHQVASGP